jgi:CRP-like cAMP-binding protein
MSAALKALSAPTLSLVSNSACQTCDIRGKGLFCKSDGSTLARIDSAKTARKYAAGESIYRAGDEPDGIYCLKRGTVKLESVGENGQAHILHVVNAGAVLGLRNILEDEVHAGNAVALQPTEVCYVPRLVFERVLREEPNVAMNALRTVATELSQMERRFCHATDLTASERIAEALLHLKDRFEAQQWSRRELAEWASTTTETAIRTLAQFEKEGILRLEGRKITILDRQELLEKAKIFVE